MTDTKIKRNGLAVLIALTLLSSCTPSEVGKRKLISIVDHHPGLNQTQEINGIQIRLKYFPYQLLVLQELEGNGRRDTMTLRALEKKYKGQCYFRLSFSRDDKEVIRQLGGAQRYSDMLQVLSFGFAKFVNATTEKKDTLPLKDYAFEQDYGMSTDNSLLLVFDRNAFAKANSIYVNIGEFGLGTGNVQFIFKQSQMNGIPTLNYERID